MKTTSIVIFLILIAICVIQSVRLQNTRIEKMEADQDHARLKESYVKELHFVDSCYMDCQAENRTLKRENDKLIHYLNTRIDNEFKKRREEQ